MASRSLSTPLPNTTWTGFVAAGADVAIYSAHKFLGGLTAGIVAGKKELIRAAYLQNAGIGRGFKVGKEGIVGAITALDAWASATTRRTGAPKIPASRTG